MTPEEADKYAVMLAHEYNQKKVIFPCFIQPKLDGIRCRAEIKDGEVTLWSRDNKRIISMDHIVAVLSQIKEDCTLDGELYTNAVPFEQLSGIVRRQYHDERSLVMQYHVYDAILPDTPYTERKNYFQSILDRYVRVDHLQCVRTVATSLVQSHDDVLAWHGNFVNQGFEGLMVRTAYLDKKSKTVVDPGYESQYHNGKRRSWSLMKFKEFNDAEFEIVGMEEEYDLSGNPKGRLGAFVCKLEDGRQFRASGILADTKSHAWANRELYIGKQATIKFFGTSQDGIPRFPNFVSIRWDDNLVE